MAAAVTRFTMGGNAARPVHCRGRWLLYFLIVLLFSSVVVESANNVLVTRPLHLSENVYFEVTEPGEISYTYKIRQAKDFGARLNTTYAGVRLVQAVPFHGCSPITNHAYIRDAIAFIERGGCSFMTKTINAEHAGALAVIITDHDVENDQRMIDMVQDETGRNTNIASFFMLGKDGFMIRNSLSSLKLDYAKINIPLNVSGVHMHTLNQPPWTLW